MRHSTFFPPPFFWATEALIMVRHQKKALTFMMQREQPWTFEGSEGDLWVKEADETGGIMSVILVFVLISLLTARRYTNLITSSSQSTPPPESRGGLLADKMGLGKSLTMISLIALNPLNLEQCNEPVIFTSTGTIRRVKSTLIVVSFSCKSSPSRSRASLIH